MNGSTPVELEHGEWHLPYAQSEDCLKTTTDNFIKLSVARCARVSYLNHDNSSPDIDKDIALYDKLLEAGHMSPFEHCCTPMEYPKLEEINNKWPIGYTHSDRHNNMWSSNLKGWIMHRNTLC